MVAYNAIELLRCIFHWIFFFFLLLIVLRSDDAALQAGSHIRLFCGGGEISLVVLLVTLVENNKGRLEWVKNRCRCARRFGSITLTLWVFQFLDLFICMFCKLDLVFFYIFSCRFHQLTCSYNELFY